MKRPEYEDFGLSPNRVEEIRKTTSLFAAKKKVRQELISIRQYFVSILPAVLLVYLFGILIGVDTPSRLAKIFLALIPASFFVYLALHFVLSKSLEKYNFENIPGYKELKEFEANYQKYEDEERKLKEETSRLRDLKRRQFWTNQDGYSFEKNIGDVFKRLGHKVRITRGSGDEGVDIFVDEDTVVQCKATESQIAPAVVRDMYGAMHHFNAKRGIIVSIGGFSSGCHQFARGKRIELWDLNKLLEVAEKLGIGHIG